MLFFWTNMRFFGHSATSSAAICALMRIRPKHSDTLVNPAAALGDKALGKRGEGCRASPLLRRGRTVQTLAKVYEDRAAECSRTAQQTDDPVFRRLLLASQWKLAAQEEAKSKDAPTSLASTQPQSLDESLPQR